jgi:hypothetical protein
MHRFLNIIARINIHSFQNSIFISVNTTIQVKLIAKVDYICVNHDMFLHVLGSIGSFKILLTLILNNFKLICQLNLI